MAEKSFALKAARSLAALGSDEQTDIDSCMGDRIFPSDNFI